MIAALFAGGLYQPARTIPSSVMSETEANPSSGGPTWSLSIRKDRGDAECEMQFEVHADAKDGDDRPGPAQGAPEVRPGRRRYRRIPEIMAPRWTSGPTKSSSGLAILRSPCDSDPGSSAGRGQPEAPRPSRRCRTLA